MAQVANEWLVEIPEIGKSMQVWLPGETPWIVVVGNLPDGRILGVIKNNLVATAGHGYVCDDIATFELKDNWWTACAPDRQIFVGPSAIPKPDTKAMAAALLEARQWVEASTAQVRGLSAQAASYGEKMLKQIDAALSTPHPETAVSP